MSCYSYSPCGQSSCNSCYPCDPCTVTSDCPIQLDTSCVIYHKNNASISGLTSLGLTNGSPLELILDQIDDKLAGFGFSAFSLPVLRTDSVVNTLQQFSEAVDTEIGLLKSLVVTNTTPVPLVANDSNTIDFTSSGVIGHSLTATVKVSATSANRLATNVDGLYVGPQTLSANYVNKEISISGGNSISLASMSSGVSGYLGNLPSDPLAVDGQYFFNTTSNQLKIKVNGVFRVISTI